MIKLEKQLVKKKAKVRIKFNRQLEQKKKQELNIETT